MNLKECARKDLITSIKNHAGQAYTCMGCSRIQEAMAHLAFMQAELRYLELFDSLEKGGDLWQFTSSAWQTVRGLIGSATLRLQQSALRIWKWLNEKPSDTEA
jgi:hypothetical protein